jgi:hypothetical protein
MIHQTIFGRAALLRSFGIPDNAWDQRASRGEVALAYGLARPVHMNEYGENDLLAVGLQLMAGRHVGHRLAAQAVRDSWRAWQAGIAVAERQKPKGFTEGVCFVIGDDTRVEVGPCQVAVDKLGSASVPFIIPLDLLLRRVRGATEEVGLDLPEHFCPGLPTSAEFKRWLVDIEAYRAAALGKRRARVTA